jgi:peptidyl-prolyl cis-trans isomerase SDCCAG10
MSNIYLLEPTTHGKVLLKCNFGDVDVELWSRECPLACRNFIQLCMEGYYDNTIVTRVMKDFMMQLGDPTGTGEGGESIWGRPFKDEVHGRIKFNHRGQLAMANSNRPNSNASQFFITFGECEWLNKKHTIFGKVTGNTIFNVMRINETEVDPKDDRPLEELRIKSAEVLLNPFDDIIPRVSLIATTAVTSDKGRGLRKAVKDTKLLSFPGDDDEDGDDDEEDEGGGGVASSSRFTSSSTYRIHSSHDSKFKAGGLKLSSKVFDGYVDLVNLSSSTPPPPSATITATATASTEDEKSVLSFEEKMRLKMLHRQISAGQKQSHSTPAPAEDDDDDEGRDGDQGKDEVKIEKKHKKEKKEKKAKEKEKEKEKGDKDVNSKKRGWGQTLSLPSHTHTHTHSETNNANSNSNSNLSEREADTLAKLQLFSAKRSKLLLGMTDAGTGTKSSSSSSSSSGGSDWRKNPL